MSLPVDTGTVERRHVWRGCHLFPALRQPRGLRTGEVSGSCLVDLHTVPVAVLARHGERLAVEIFQVQSNGVCAVRAEGVLFLLRALHLFAGELRKLFFREPVEGLHCAFVAFVCLQVSHWPPGLRRVGGLGGLIRLIALIISWVVG